MYVKKKIMPFIRKWMITNVHISMVCLNPLQALNKALHVFHICPNLSAGSFDANMILLRDIC
jgi:hypothetical protein